MHKREVSTWNTEGASQKNVRTAKTFQHPREVATQDQLILPLWKDHWVASDMNEEEERMLSRFAKVQTIGGDVN